MQTASLREKFDKELRSREQEARSRFERDLLVFPCGLNLHCLLPSSYFLQDMQHSYESTIARKDSELSSLLNSMRQSAQQSLDAAEFEAKLEAELEKRRVSDDKTRAALTELAEANANLQETRSHLEETMKIGISSYSISTFIYC